MIQTRTVNCCNFSSGRILLEKLYASINLPATAAAATASSFSLLVSTQCNSSELGRNFPSLPKCARMHLKNSNNISFGNFSIEAAKPVFL